jgi:hypothetical protein
MATAKKPEPEVKAEVKQEVKAEAKTEGQPEKDLNAQLIERAEVNEKTRWIKSWAFNSPAGGHLITLDELRNLANPNTHDNTDTTDMGMAYEILARADLLGNRFSDELQKIIAGALSTIKDPLLFLNPDHAFKDFDVERAKLKP